MTTARERMKALSGLSGSHSARAHFLAITQGTGTGQTIFASMFAVQIDEPRLTLVQRPKREAQESKRSVAPVVSGDRQGGGNVSICVRQNALWVMSGRNELFIRQANSTSIVAKYFGQARLTVRQSDVIEIN